MKVAIGGTEEAFLGCLLLDGFMYFFATVMASTDEDGRERIFADVNRGPLYAQVGELAADLDAQQIPLDAGVYDVFDLDRALAAADSLESSTDFHAVLGAWDGIADVLRSAGKPFEFRGRVANRAYDKLFWGLNLPSMVPPGQRYTPAWSAKERRKIRQLIRVGVDRVRGEVAKSAMNGAMPRSRLWSDFVIESDSDLLVSDWADG